MRKTFLILFSALVAMASGVRAATDYGFKMFGIPINSDNYKSQNSEGIWYYDPTNNVLHLREGNMTVGTQNTPIIVINGDVNPTLTIQVDGACRFSGLFSEGILFEGNGKHTICGDGTLTMEPALINQQIIQSRGNTSLTIKDVTINIKSYGGSAVGFLNMSFSEIILDNCEINIETSNVYAWSAINEQSARPVLKNCVFTNGYFGTNGTAYDPTGKPLKELHIKRMPVSTVDLTVVEPVAGNVVSTKCTAKSDKYYATIAEWYKIVDGYQIKMKEGDAFKDGETYLFIAILRTTEGYSFADKEDITVYANGTEGEIYAYHNNQAITINCTFDSNGLNTRHDLWVCGRQVTRENQSDVLGDGAFRYSAKKNVLTVSGDKTYKGSSIIENKIKGLTVYVAGDATLNNQELTALKSEVDMTVTGPGKLTLASTNDAALFLSKTATLTLKDANVDASGQWGVCGPFGNSYNAKLDIINSTVVSKSTESDGAVCDFRGGITLTGCQIAVPEGGRVDGARIVDANGTAAKEVTIVVGGYTRADVNRDGTVDSADIVAVIKEMPDGDKKADVNGDTVIDSADIVAVIKAMK